MPGPLRRQVLWRCSFCERHCPRKPLTNTDVYLCALTHNEPEPHSLTTIYKKVLRLLTSLSITFKYQYVATLNQGTRPKREKLP